MTKEEYEYIQKFVFDNTAIRLENGKEYLVETRLLPVAKELGIASVSEVIKTLRNFPFGDIHREVVDAMTTNETLFFRDLHPFETLKKTIIPEIMKNRALEKNLNIWCGAASSGQEPYSIALVLKDFFPELSSWRTTFIASDISETMLERCRSGIYNQFEINRGLPITLLAKYFTKNSGDWQIKDEIKKMVDFRNVNLIGNWPIMPKMDIIFLRNVLIYFDTDVKKKILAKIREVLRPDGYFFLGGSESTIGIDDEFERVVFDKTICYRIKSK